MSDVAPTPVQPDPNLINDLIAGIVERRDLKSKMEAEHKAAVANVDAQIERASAVLLQMLNSSGATSAKYPAGTVIVKNKRKVNLADRDAFLNYVRETGQVSLLQARVAVKAVDEFMENNDGQVPPGVDVTTERDGEIRRARS